MSKRPDDRPDAAEFAHLRKRLVDKLREQGYSASKANQAAQTAMGDVPGGRRRREIGESLTQWSHELPLATENPLSNFRLPIMAAGLTAIIEAGIALIPVFDPMQTDLMVVAGIAIPILVLALNGNKSSGESGKAAREDQ